jgi:transcriptional regulator GlxA family with amidase domain
MELLVKADTNITEVAYAAGFYILTAFAKTFSFFWVDPD